MSHNKNKKIDEKKDLKNLSEKEGFENIICECEDCREVIEKLKKENIESELAYKRALADYQNLVKHSSSEKVEFFKYSLEKFFLEILPIFDNLKMAISTLNEDEQNNPWVEGIKYVIKQFRDAFSENGIEEIKTAGEKFDYNKMEAVKGDGEIVKKEIRPGYILNGKVIIPAKVVLFFKDDPENKIK
ncbi:MAG TPA: nucleotide exchange factor GrpE [bacterium]|nr:nucleotide exchange factor GrpE [bacterium]